MAGQREARHAIGPGYNTPAAVSPQPSVRTTQETARAANYQAPERPVSGLGDALAGFFGTAAKTMDKLAEIDHREELVKIERENRALGEQAQADQAAGNGPNFDHMSRQAYAGTYTRAAADESARAAGESLRAKLRDIPLDGSIDPRAVAEEHFKAEFGPSGSGHGEYDAAWINTYRRNAEQQVVQSQERIAQTREVNTFETLKSSWVSTLLDPAKSTPGAMAELETQVLTATRGNQAQADKLLESTVSAAFVNDGNATAILNSMRNSGYAQRNPDSYLRLSENAFQRTNAIKTWQAGTEVEQWNSDLDAAVRKGNGFVPLNDLLGYAQRAFTIDSKHGVGAGRFTDKLNTLWAAAAKSQSEVNVILTSLVTGVPGPLVAAQNGVEISKAMEKHFDPAVAQYVAMNAERFPALSKTPAGQPVNPLASPQAAEEYARIIGAPAFVNAAPEGQSSTYKVMLGNALIGADSNLASNAVRVLSTYESMTSPELTRKLVRSDDEWNLYQAAKNSGKDYGAFFSDRYAKPSETKVLTEAERGTLNWAALTGKPDAKRDEVRTEVLKAQDGALLKSVGRDGWFRDPKVNMSDRMRQEYDAKLATFLAEQKRSGGSTDLAEAAKHVLVSLKTEATVIPGQDGSLMLYPKPKGLGGEQRDNPIRLPNGKTAYAPGRVRNYADEDEDTIDTFREDMDALPKSLPAAFTVGGQEFDADSAYLDAPGASGVNGLHTVLLSGGQRIMFMPGQRITVRRDAGEQSIDLGGPMPASFTPSKTANEVSPTDPIAFEQFMAPLLPKGFHLIPGHAGNGSVFYVVGYSFRLKKDREWYDARIARH